MLSCQVNTFYMRTHSISEHILFENTSCMKTHPISKHMPHDISQHENTSYIKHTCHMISHRSSIRSTSADALQAWITGILIRLPSKRSRSIGEHILYENTFYIRTHSICVFHQSDQGLSENTFYMRTYSISLSLSLSLSHTHTHTHTHTVSVLPAVPRPCIKSDHCVSENKFYMTHTHIHTYTHTQVHTYTHTRIHAYTHTHIHAYTHTHIHTYTNTHIHTYIHTHIHTYTHS